MAISNPDLLNFFKSARQKKFSAGEIVLRGEDPSGVILILDGFVSVYSISDAGDHYTHVIYKAGELFPLIWALNNTHRKIFYEALSDVVVAKADRNEFLKFIKTDPLITYEVLEQLSQQFYIFADRLDNLQYKSAKEKVAYRLMFLAGRFGERNGQSVVIKAPLTHAVISETVNLARETVSRELESLEKKGIIGTEGQYLIIKDIAKLGKEFSEPISLDLWGLKEE